jgi:hypothetical protein
LLQPSRTRERACAANETRHLGQHPCARGRVVTMLRPTAPAAGRSRSVQLPSNTNAVSSVD